MQHFRVCMPKEKAVQSIVVGNGKPSAKHKYPIESITVGMEGLQILKPVALQGIMLNGIPEKGILQNGLTEREKPNYGNHGGVNVEVELMAPEDGDIVESMANWMVESLKFSVKEPIEAVVTKDKRQHLVLLCKSEVDSMGRIATGVLCKSEVDSMGRIATGVLCILKLEGSISSAAISQLSNLGSKNFDRIFTPEKLSGGSSPSNFGLSPSCNFIQGSCGSGLDSTMASLEDSQSKCAALTAELINRCILVIFNACRCETRSSVELQNFSLIGYIQKKLATRISRLQRALAR